MEDPNWFFSTLAQSAAAIVGLIGAFLVSRIVEQANEVRGKKKEFNEKISSLRTEIEKVKDDLKKLRGWYNSDIESLKKNSNNKKDSVNDPHLTITVNLPTDDFKAILNLFSDGFELFEEQIEFLSNIEIRSFMAFKKPIEFYSSISKHLEQWNNSSFAGVSIKDRKLGGHFIDILDLNNKILEIKKDYEEFADSLIFLPSYFKYGLYILGFIAIFCVIAPLFFLSASPHKFLGFYVKNLLLTLFTIGIISLLVFFKLQIDEIRKFVNP